MGHRDPQSESVSVHFRDRSGDLRSIWSVCKRKWFQPRKRTNSIKRTSIPLWMSFERSSPDWCNKNQHPRHRRPVGSKERCGILNVLHLVSSIGWWFCFPRSSSSRSTFETCCDGRTRSTGSHDVSIQYRYSRSILSRPEERSVEWFSSMSWASLWCLGAGSCAAGLCPLPSVDVTITLTNPEDLRLLSTGDSNELVQAYLSQRITIDGSLQDALHLKNLADALRRENILLFNASSK